MPLTYVGCDLLAVFVGKLVHTVSCPHHFKEVNIQIMECHTSLLTVILVHYVFDDATMSGKSSIAYWLPLLLIGGKPSAVFWRILQFDMVHLCNVSWVYFPEIMTHFQFPHSSSSVQTLHKSPLPAELFQARVLRILWTIS